MPSTWFCLYRLLCSTILFFAKIFGNLEIKKRKKLVVFLRCLGKLADFFFKKHIIIKLIRMDITRKYPPLKTLILKHSKQFIYRYFLSLAGLYFHRLMSLRGFPSLFFKLTYPKLLFYYYFF